MSKNENEGPCDCKALKIDTICVRGDLDYQSRDDTGAVCVPIYQSATFAHPELGNSTGYDYSRLKNPTRDYLEKLWLLWTRLNSALLTTADLPQLLRFLMQ